MYVYVSNKQNNNNFYITVFKVRYKVNSNKNTDVSYKIYFSCDCLKIYKFFEVTRGVQ